MKISICLFRFKLSFGIFWCKDWELEENEFGIYLITLKGRKFL